MSKTKLAVTDAGEGVALVRSSYAEVHESAHLGMNTALALLPQKARFTTRDLHEWIERILDHAADAPDNELPGLTEALACVLSSDERPAAELIDERRFPRGRLRRNLSLRWRRRR